MNIAPDTQLDAAVSAIRWHGALDGLHGRLLVGWAFDSARPEARVVVEVCIDDLPCGCVVADVARADLAARLRALGAADVCHGFVVDLDAVQGASSGTVSARVANFATPGAQLAGGFRLEAPKAPPAGSASGVVGDGGLRLHGWALDPADPARTLAVRAYLGHTLVAEARADLLHPAMRGQVEGAHGFDLALPARLADGRVHSVRVVDEDGRQVNGSPLTVCCTLDGIAALLPAEGADTLLRRVADSYERHLPRSLPLSGWAEWSARFEQAGPDSLPELGTAVIVSGDAGLEATVASIRAQHGMAVQVFAGASFAESMAQALAANCEVLCCLRAGDLLAPHALAWALEAFRSPQAQVVYTDSECGGRPWFKPAWNPDYALASDYPLGLLLVRRTLAHALAKAGDAAGFAWAALAAAWPQGLEAIVHVPRVLVKVQAPDAAEQGARLAAAARALAQVAPEALLEALPETPAGVTHAARRVRHPLPQGAREMTVSLVIPTRDRADLLQRCIDTIRQHTDWPKLEIIVIDNGSVEEATHAYFDRIAQDGVRVLAMPGPFNYANLNNRAIAQAGGEIVGLVNNDIEALHPGWLDEIVSQLLRPGVGAVGAKLLWPNGMVQHGGVLLGVGNVAGHFGNRLLDADWGDHGRNQLAQQVSGCTAACLFLRRQDYLALGGMDGHAFPVAFNDVDLCLKVRAAGKAIVWAPHARLLHAESASRGHEDTPQKKARAAREVECLRRKWGEVLLQDPAYHPSLNLDPNSQAFGGLALPPRGRAPRSGAFPAPATFA
jgi:GT2 family glycosyltransferase